MARDTISAPESSNLSLARRLADGSSAAWGDLVDLYGPLVDRWCRVAGVPQEAIPDIAQETFFSVFRGIHGFEADRPGATFRGWLWTVARSRIQDFYRRHRRLNAARSDEAGFNVELFPDPVPVEEPSETTDVIALTRRAMKRIESEFQPHTWQMFWDSVVLGHPTALIAERYEVSTAAVRQARSRVLRRLRQEIGC